MTRYLFALACLALVSTAQAQERPNAILVLDGSGSMWGQIDGVAKITIAQEVIGGLLETLPAEQALGLTVYGHRRKGDCGDIETMIVPGGDRAAIAEAVNGINPKGKTPLSAAVIAAAEALRYTEERATVILVSDGRETCDFDPCEVGSQLEETGVDFTAHVIGFDVSDPADRAELQCLADRTGGVFRTASNASELGDALAVVAEPPAPEPVTVSLRATEGAGGPVISDGLTWSLSGDAVVADLDANVGPTPRVVLDAGDYTAVVTRAVDGATAEAAFAVAAEDMTVTLVLPELPPPPVMVTIYATDGRNGPEIRDDLMWELTGGGETHVDNQLVPRVEAQLSKGEYVVSVMRPVDEATAELRFGVGTVNKTVVLELPEYRPAATLEAVETAVAGTKIDVRWTGPDERNDFISVVATDGSASEYVEFTYTREGPLLKLLMPPREGSYEIRYILNDGRKILARKAVEVTPVTASLSPPESLPAGDTVPIDWTGPDYANDFLAVTGRGKDGYINYTYTREGSPLGLELPGEAGEYDLIYTMNQKRTIIARVPITVTAVDYTVSAPATAVAGSTVQVDWTGPDYKNDYIAVTKVGADGSRYINYTYTREGSPLDLQMPTETGTYEVHYVLNQDRKIMASATIEVTALEVGLTAPETAVAGSTVQVDWTGPDYKNDYIDVARTGAKGNAYINYTYTRKGSPLTLQMPVNPGSYEIRYIVNQDRVVKATVPIEVTALSAGVTGPQTARAGSVIQVDWTGPDYKNDYIAIAKAGSKDDKYIAYTYTREGSPLELRTPLEPGEYELRYVINQDRKVSARQSIVIDAASASLQAETTAPMGGLVTVDWEGPAEKSDFIAISAPDMKDDKYITYTYTREGSPLQVQVPSTPGAYELRYVAVSVGRKVLERVPLEVAPVTASLQAEATVAPGGNLAVIWEGPDNARDYITISRVGDDGYETYVYTRKGSPLILKVPKAPGAYEVRYVLGHERVVLTTQALTVE